MSCGSEEATRRAPALISGREDVPPVTAIDESSSCPWLLLWEKNKRHKQAERAGGRKEQRLSAVACKHRQLPVLCKHNWVMHKDLTIQHALRYTGRDIIYVNTLQ